MPEPRLDLIDHIRQQITEGRYATEGKLRVVADRLLERIREGDPTSCPMRRCVNRGESPQSHRASP